MYCSLWKSESDRGATWQWI